MLSDHGFHFFICYRHILKIYFCVSLTSSKRVHHKMAPYHLKIVTHKLHECKQTSKHTHTHNTSTHTPTHTHTNTRNEQGYEHKHDRGHARPHTHMHKHAYTFTKMVSPFIRILTHFFHLTHGTSKAYDVRSVWKTTSYPPPHTHPSPPPPAPPPRSSTQVFHYPSASPRKFTRRF